MVWGGIDTNIEGIIMYSLFITIVLGMFGQDFGIREIKTPINIVDEATYEIEMAPSEAFCRHYYGKKPDEIFIRAKYLETLPYHWQIELLYHELGHCELGLKHTAFGIMRPRHYSTKADLSNWPALVAQMKKLWHRRK